jgi:hypothetical protein
MAGEAADRTGTGGEAAATDRPTALTDATAARLSWPP